MREAAITQVMRKLETHLRQPCSNLQQKLKSGAFQMGHCTQTQAWQISQHIQSQRIFRKLSSSIIHTAEVDYNQLSLILGSVARGPPFSLYSLFHGYLVLIALG